jgi:hypothetical protein
MAQPTKFFQTARQDERSVIQSAASASENHIRQTKIREGNIAAAAKPVNAGPVSAAPANGFAGMSSCDTDPADHEGMCRHQRVEVVIVSAHGGRTVRVEPWARGVTELALCAAATSPPMRWFAVAAPRISDTALGARCSATSPVRTGLRSARSVRWRPTRRWVVAGAATGSRIPPR